MLRQIGSCEVHLPMSIVQQVLDHVHQSVARGIDRMKTSPELIPVILCGGGSILLDVHQSFPGVSQVADHRGERDSREGYLLVEDHSPGSLCRVQRGRRCSLFSQCDCRFDRRSPPVVGGWWRTTSA